MTSKSPPVLYSFRRCPYAIRARMAIAYSGLTVELREVVLRNKPASMLEASSKGTVPILLLSDDRVIDESYDVMRWAMELDDPDYWWQNSLAEETKRLVTKNDLQFKTHLDHYKYADRYPDHPQSHYRVAAESFLAELESRLTQHKFLLTDQLTFADVAIFPFIRQFAFVDKPWFDQSPYPGLLQWLQSLLESSLFIGVMKKLPAWNAGDAPIRFPEMRMPIGLK
jgi:glutathione S-transferase